MKSPLVKKPAGKAARIAIRRSIFGMAGLPERSEFVTVFS